MTKKKISVDVTKHILVPKHSKLTEKEKQDLFEKYKVTLKELPKISKKDPAIQELDVKAGDIIKITRPSFTAKETVFYRGVTDD